MKKKMLCVWLRIQLNETYSTGEYDLFIYLFIYLFIFVLIYNPGETIQISMRSIVLPWYPGGHVLSKMQGLRNRRISFFYCIEGKKSMKIH